MHEAGKVKKLIVNDDERVDITFDEEEGSGFDEVSVSLEYTFEKRNGPKRSSEEVRYIRVEVHGRVSLLELPRLGGE